MLLLPCTHTHPHTHTALRDRKKRRRGGSDRPAGEKRARRWLSSRGRRERKEREKKGLLLGEILLPPPLSCRRWSGLAETLTKRLLLSPVRVNCPCCTRDSGDGRVVRKLSGVKCIKLFFYRENTFGKERERERERERLLDSSSRRGHREVSNDALCASTPP